MLVMDCSLQMPCSNIRYKHQYTWHQDTLGRRMIVDFVAVAYDKDTYCTHPLGRSSEHVHLRTCSKDCFAQLSWECLEILLEELEEVTVEEDVSATLFKLLLP